MHQPWPFFEAGQKIRVANLMLICARSSAFKDSCTSNKCLISRGISDEIVSTIVQRFFFALFAECLQNRAAVSRSQSIWWLKDLCLAFTKKLCDHLSTLDQYFKTEVDVLNARSDTNLRLIFQAIDAAICTLHEHELTNANIEQGHEAYIALCTQVLQAFRTEQVNEADGVHKNACSTCAFIVQMQRNICTAPGTSDANRGSL